jgi:hypothetical protein
VGTGWVGPPKIEEVELGGAVPKTEEPAEEAPLAGTPKSELEPAGLEADPNNEEVGAGLAAAVVDVEDSDELALVDGTPNKELEAAGLAVAPKREEAGAGLAAGAGAEGEPEAPSVTGTVLKPSPGT